MLLVKLVGRGGASLGHSGGFLDIITVVDPAKIIPHGRTEIDQLHIVKVQQERHRRGKTESELCPLRAAVVHVLDLDVGVAFEGVPMVLAGVSPLPNGSQVRHLGVKHWGGGGRGGGRGGDSALIHTSFGRNPIGKGISRGAEWRKFQLHSTFQ